MAGTREFLKAAGKGKWKTEDGEIELRYEPEPLGRFPDYHPYKLYLCGLRIKSFHTSREAKNYVNNSKYYVKVQPVGR